VAYVLAARLAEGRDVDTARASYREAARRFAALGDEGRRADCLDRLGNTYLDHDDPATALGIFEEARQALRDARGDRDRTLAQSLERMAVALARTGRPREAIARLEEAQALLGTPGGDELDLAASVAIALAKLHYRAGEREAARGCFERADRHLVASRESSARSAAFYGYFAQFEREGGRLDRALELAGKAGVLAHKAPDTGPLDLAAIA
jgi:tetratricopeptide (TPR) repeat protein